MRYALDDEQRRTLLRVSAMLVCGGLAILPLTMPPSAVDAQAEVLARGPRISVPAVPERLQFPVIAVQRDPFVADEAASGVTHDIGDIALPPNAGAASMSGVSAASGIAVVRGIVLGVEPQALIDTGNGIKVFGIGDRLANDSIRAIDAGGVTLASGTVLKIASVQQ